jgi:poly(ADP-ribose) glycohydrolase
MLITSATPRRGRSLPKSGYPPARCGKIFSEKGPPRIGLRPSISEFVRSAQRQMKRILPCSSSLLCQDRFSLIDSDEAQIPFWRILEAILSEPVLSANDVLDRLDTIAITLRGSSHGNQSGLKAHICSSPDYERRFCSDVWPKLVAVALEMPELFPDVNGDGLPVLSTRYTKHVFSRRQVACLVIHQFLCTLSETPWMATGGQSPDFSIWYSSNQPHEGAGHAYIITLFHYFDRIAGDDPLIMCSPIDEWPVTYALVSNTSSGSDKDATESQGFTTLSVIRTDEATTQPSYQGPEIGEGAVVISANRFIGFGRGGTQEEVQVGSSPECCPAVLFTPPLRDEDVLVVRRAEAMAIITGYGRTAKLQSQARDDCHQSELISASGDSGMRRTLLFMDALELDQEDHGDLVPDLAQGNVARELGKCFAAFSSYDAIGQTRYSHITTGLWGCGAFDGDPYIKVVIQWAAASIVGVPLRFICQDEAYADSLAQFVRDVRAGNWAVRDVLNLLRNMSPGDKEARSAFDAIRKGLH